MTIDYITAAGQVRLLISDVNESTPILTDDQITGFLTINTQAVKRAAADALDAIATSEALVSKAITANGLTTDGPAVAKALRDQAKALRDQATIDDETGDAFQVGVVEFDDGETWPPELGPWPRWA